MEPFKIEIAGLIAEVHPLFETSALYCRNYLTDQIASFRIAVTKEDLAFEQHMLDIEAREEGLKRRKFTDPFLERAVIQRKIAKELLDYDTLLLHGSTIAVDGAAYLFTAACGTGKSTHTRLWREVFGERAVMINDDKPFLRISADGVVAYGSPWSGKHGLDSNVCAPLKGICTLHRGDENSIQRIDACDAISMLQHQSYVFADTLSQTKVSNLVEKLAQRVPLWEMYCTKTHEAASIAFAAMSPD